MCLQEQNLQDMICQNSKLTEENIRLRQESQQYEDVRKLLL